MKNNSGGHNASNGIKWLKSPTPTVSNLSNVQQHFTNGNYAKRELRRELIWHPMP